MARRTAARSKLKAGNPRRYVSSAAVGEAVLTPAVESALFAPREREQFAFERRSTTFDPIEFEFGDKSATYTERANENRVPSATFNGDRPPAGNSPSQEPAANGQNAACDLAETTGSPCHAAEKQVHATPEMPTARDQLTAQQRAAAAALVHGGNIQATADALGMERKVLRHWVMTDPLFHLAMEEMRQEIVISMRQKLLGLAASALDLVEGQLDSEQRTQVALRLMRRLGVIGRQAKAELLHAPHVVPPDAPIDATAKNENGIQTATSSGETAEPLSSRPPAAQQMLDQLASAFVHCRTGESDEAQRGTPAEEAAAVEALFAGRTPSEAAALAQISEAKLRHWLHSNARFCLALAEKHIERLCELRGRLWTLLEKATGIVISSLTGGDARTALTLLRGIGLLS